MACSRCGAFLVVAAGQYQTIKKKNVILKPAAITEESSGGSENSNGNSTLKTDASLIHPSLRPMGNAASFRRTSTIDLLPS